MDKVSDSPFITTPIAIIIGSLIIGGSILFSSGGLNIKGYKSGDSAKAIAPAGATQDEKLADLAKQINLDPSKLTSCLENKKFQSVIDKDLEDAQAAGADGTPTFVIGKSSDSGEITGARLVGAQPFNVFKTMIDEAIASPTYPKTAEASESAKVALSDSPVLGEKNAPITIVEFSDYECPFCKSFYETSYPSIIKEYVDTGKVKMVFRNLPLSFHDPAATLEANAALCAREQGGDEAYFKYHDALFENTKSNGEGV